MNSKAYILLYGLLLSFFLIGCDKNEKENRSPLAKYQGEWIEAGSGLAIDIRKNSVTAYRYTRETCSIISRFDSLDDADAELTNITSSNNKNYFSFIPAGFSEFSRIDLIAHKLPVTCTNAPDPQEFDPVFIFDHTWNAFNDYYPFFELRGVDWLKQREIYRPLVNSDTSQQELFELITEMLSSLDDSHVGLVANTNGLQRGFSSGRYTGWQATALAIAKHESLDTDFANYIYQLYLPDKFSEILTVNYGSDEELHTSNLVDDNNSPPILRWGKLVGNIGYLQINSMEANEEVGTFSVEDQLKSIKSLMNTVISELNDTQGMIIDVRFNGGGFDELSLAIASYFANQRQLVYSKENYNRGEPSDRKIFYLEPNPDITYSKPVTLITGPDTASAAEIFTMAMRVLPQVNVIGEPTHGVHSDILEFKLMAGWDLYLSYQTYYAADDQIYEYIGIPPEINIPVASYQGIISFAALAAIHQALVDFGVDLTLSNSDFLQRAQSILDETGIPGLSVTWIDDSHILGSSAIGYANLEKQLPVMQSTPFNIASISKTFIGVSIMQMMERSLIDINTSLGDLAMPFSVTNPYFSAEDITIIDLATHTSGIQDGSNYQCGYYVESDQSCLAAKYSVEFANCPEPVETNQARFLASLLDESGSLYDLSQFTNNEPGSDFIYSNLGAALAVEMLTTASGTDFETWTEEYIFQPLKMSHTHWFSRRFEQENEIPASRYLLVDGKATALPEYAIATWGDGGLKASTPDLARYLLTIVQGGILDGQRILQQDSVNYMLSSVFEGPTPLGHQGIFWYGDKLMFGHDGSDPGTYAQMEYEQYNQVGLVMMLNLSDELNENEALESQLARLNHLIYRRGISLKEESERR